MWHLQYFFDPGQWKLAPMSGCHRDDMHSFERELVARQELNVFLRAVERSNVQPHGQQNVVACGDRPYLLGMV